MIRYQPIRHEITREQTNHAHTLHRDRNNKHGCHGEMQRAQDHTVSVKYTVFCIINSSFAVSCLTIESIATCHRTPAFTRNTVCTKLQDTSIPGYCIAAWVPDEQQLLSSPDRQRTQTHHTQVQQHEEQAAEPILNPAGVHPSIPEDQPEGNGCHQGGYEVDKDEEGVAVQLAHEAG